MVVRAKIFSSEAISRLSTTHSYIFHPRKTAFPILSFATKNDYLYNAKGGIFSSEKTYGKYNYDYNWRRPANSEMINSSDNSLIFNQAVEIAVGGNYSREFAQKSIKLYANKRFGEKRLNGHFWEDKQNVTSVKSFTLRNGGNSLRRLRITDAYLQRLWGVHINNIDYQAYSPSIVYINGEFYGFAGLRERSNEDWIEANYGLEDIEFATHLSYRAADAEQKTTSFQDVYKLYSRNNCTYEELSEKIDIDNFMKTMIAEMNAINHDWPHNNVSMWRPNEQGAKWRWIIKDMDFYALSNYDNPIEFNMFNYLLGTVNAEDVEYRYFSKKNVKESSKLYRKLMSFPKFKEDFLDAYSVYLGDFLKPSVTNALLSDMTSSIRDEIIATYSAYEFDTSNYQKSINKMKDYNLLRPRIVYNQMSTFFSLGSVIPLTIHSNSSNVSINNIPLTEGDFDGAWFSKRELHLESGSPNKGWKMETWRKERETFKIIEERLYPQASLEINPIEFNESDSLSFSIYTFDNSEFDNKLHELGISLPNQKDWSQDRTINIETPDYAYANVYGLTSLPTNKTDAKQAIIDFYDNNGNHFQKKIFLCIQGNSTPKSNFSISFVEDEWEGQETTEITFGSWIPQDEFHLKAFYEDGIRGTAEVAYQLYGQISPRERCHPDAFPMSLYINGDFYGVMSWQLKKHRANMNLLKKEPTNVWLDGTINDKQIFGGSINWTKFEVRNPKDLKTMKGSDYDGDNPQELIDETSSAYDSTKSKMARTAQTKAYIVDLSCINTNLEYLEASGATIEEMKNAINNRFDVTELVNYMVFSLVTNNYDGFSQNWQWFTYDGYKWTIAPYDCNLTFGYNEDGKTLWPASQGSKKYDYKLENIDCNGPMKWIRKYFWDSVKQRYKELRESGIISTENITSLFINWTNRIGDSNFSSEWEKWKDSPIKYRNQENEERFHKWNEERIALNDIYLGYRTEIVNYDLTITASGWATLCVPFSFEIPSGMNVYNVIGVKDSNLVLQATSQTIANKPYLVNAQKGVYSLNGTHVVGSTSEEAYLSNGLLKGTLNEIYAPANSYVLQNLNDILGFYHVAFENSISVQSNRAYLDLPTESVYDIFRLPAEIEDVKAITQEHDQQIYYDILGRSVSCPQSLFYISIDSKGIIRKNYR